MEKYQKFLIDETMKRSFGHAQIGINSPLETDININVETVVFSNGKLKLLKEDNDA